jgi:hypothetical protein
MNIFEESVLDLIKVLNKHGVKYILVGGLAVNYHGYSRTTGDVDIWLEESPGNRKKLVSAFEEYGIKGAETFLNHPLQAGFSEVLLDAGIYLDLMTSLQTFSQENFSACYEAAVLWQLGDNLEIKVLSLNALLEEKEKSKRPKDQLDAAELNSLKRKKDTQ